MTTVELLGDLIEEARVILEETETGIINENQLIKLIETAKKISQISKEALSSIR